MPLLETFSRALGLEDPGKTAVLPDINQRAVPGLDQEILRFSARRGDGLTLGECMEGLIAFGETGSGKSSSLRTIARALLANGLGGLVCCVKDDEAAFWRRLARETGREADVVEFAPGKAAFNFLDFESRQATAAVSNLAAILSEAAVIIGGQMETDIWLQASERLSRTLLTILYCHRERIDLRELSEAVLALPTDDETPAAWERESVLAAWLRAPILRPHPDLEISTAYVREGWRRVPDRMRGGIAETFSILSDLLQRAPLPELLGGESTVTPDDCRRGKIVLLDYPVLNHGKASRVAQVIFKVAAQRAFQRGGSATAQPPVFLWVDECQYLVGPTDALFSSTARGFGIVTVYLTQNLPNWHAEAGGTLAAQQRMLAVASNLTTKLFCLNSDAATNEFAANLIGKEKLRRKSTTTQSARGSRPGAARSTTYTETDEFLCPPERFQKLRNGRKRNGYICTAIVYKTGRKWSSGQRFLEARFDQKNRRDLPWSQTLACAATVGCVVGVLQWLGVLASAGFAQTHLVVPALQRGFNGYQHLLESMQGGQVAAEKADQMVARLNDILGSVYNHGAWIYPALSAGAAVVVLWRMRRRCARAVFKKS